MISDMADDLILGEPALRAAKWKGDTYINVADLRHLLALVRGMVDDTDGVSLLGELDARLAALEDAVTNSD